MKTEEEILSEAREIAKVSGLYFIRKDTTKDGKTIHFYMLFRRLPFGGHGTLVATCTSPETLLRKVRTAAEVK